MSKLIRPYFPTYGIIVIAVAYIYLNYFSPNAQLARFETDGRPLPTVVANEVQEKPDPSRLLETTELCKNGPVLFYLLPAVPCSDCLKDQPMITARARAHNIATVAWLSKATPKEAARFYKNHGTRFDMVANDQTGELVKQLVPTISTAAYFVDEKCIINYALYGTLNMPAWSRTIAPTIAHKHQISEPVTAKDNPQVNSTSAGTQP